MFWDAESVKLIGSSGLSGREVYKEIGSTAYTDGVDPEVIKSEFDRWDGIFMAHDIRGESFQDFYTELPIDYQFIKAWAREGSAGWVDRYWDTCIATSTNFMYNKPPIMYMLG